jgi:biopolymer transport protein ExbB/TolQ
MNFAPRMPTIIIALAFIVLGLLGTVVGVLPSFVGVSGETIGVWAFLVAGAVLLAGMLVEGI